MESEIGSRSDFLEVENGEDALKIIQTQHVDFVILDWNLATKMTGLDVLKIIRQMDQFKQLPVVMVTSESDKTNVIISLKIGANDFVVKPIDKKSFAEKILKVIG